MSLIVRVKAEQSIVRAIVLWILSQHVGLAAVKVANVFATPAAPGQVILYTTTDGKGNFLITGQNPDGAFLSKLDSSANVVFASNLPGAIPAATVADSQGNVYWIGHTFIEKLNGTNGSVLWKFDAGNLVIPDTLAVDESDRVVIAGLSPFGALFNTPGAYRAPAGAPYDSFALIRISPSGTLDFATNFGGTKLNCTPTPTSCVAAPFTQPRKILLDSASHIWVLGSTLAADLPVTPTALKRQCGCNEVSGDGFLAEFNEDASRLIYATYFGTAATAGYDSSGDDFINSADMDSFGRIWFAGYTSGSDIPVTPDAAQAILAGDTDGFVAAFDPTQNKVVYATYYGVGQVTNVTRILAGEDDYPVVSGRQGTTSWNDQTTGSDFVAAFHGAMVQVATFPVGGSATGLARAPNGQFVVTGRASQAKLVQFNADLSSSIFSVTNSARLIDGAQISPGEIITIFGTNLGPNKGVTASIVDNELPLTLAGVQVLFDGAAAPLLYVSSNQINAVVPFLFTHPSPIQRVTANVTYNGVISTPAALDVYKATPGVFLAQGSDQGFAGPAAEITEAGVVNGVAQPGEVVAVFATGLGSFTTTPINGALIEAPLPSLQNQVEVNWEGGPLQVLYAGPAPGLVAGAMQINFRLPVGIDNAPPLTVSVNGWLSNLFSIPSTQN